MDSRPSNIYALIDPRTNKIMYIGQTIQLITKRLKAHIWFVKSGRDKTRKSKWIKDLLLSGHKPTILKIDEAIYGMDSDNLEAKWISYYRKINKELTNDRSGGNSSEISKEQKAKLSIKGRASLLKKTILQYSLSGDFIKEYHGIRNMNIEFNMSWRHIVACCKGTRSQANGFQWRYKSDIILLKIPSVEKRGERSIKQFDGDLIVGHFKSAAEAHRLTYINRKSINNCCLGIYKSAGGFVWKYDSI